MPHPARRLSLEMEARAGERRVALHDSESAKQFQALLKKTPKAAHGNMGSPSGSFPGALETEHLSTSVESDDAPFPLPQVTPKPTNRRVGQRASEHDPVGEEGATVELRSISCSFTEVIPVTLTQMEAVGIFCFECPVCLAVRDLHPKERAVVKFRSHPRRTTSTPNCGKRWVRREGVWKPTGEQGVSIESKTAEAFLQKERKSE
ncbi:hypothetical protein [Reticulibacter mediterranei]|uniref:hypothetical protein n=1 Tax=Reticulibacter mediterranei TaxID=2778369 RepID=UPI001C68E3DB|nr:hypothetical protein [Reticulibacter mediterranei]